MLNCLDRSLGLFKSKKFNGFTMNKASRGNFSDRSGLLELAFSSLNRGYRGRMQSGGYYG